MSAFSFKNLPAIFTMYFGARFFGSGVNYFSVFRYESATINPSVQFALNLQEINKFLKQQ